MQFFSNTNYDFVRWRWYAITLSLVVALAGAAVIWKNGLQKGVDFEGGTIVIVKFEQPTELERIRGALSASMPNGGEAVVQYYGPPENNEVMIRVPRTGAEAGSDLSKEAEAVMSALRAGNLGTFSDPPLGTEIVGPVVGEQLRRQGILATVLALAGILTYIAFRFQLSFAIGAVAATLHDLVICFAFLAFFKYDLTLNVIAGLLTITGYSVNDTIVIFDRVRENMRGMRRDNLAHIVNTAVNQTLSRTIITAGTTLMSVIALFLFGGEVLEAFAFTMIVGIISGTYSTVFIASAIAIMLQGRKGLKGQAAAAPATPATSATSTAPPSTPPGSRTPAAAGGRKPGRRRAG